MNIPGPSFTFEPTRSQDNVGLEMRTVLPTDVALFILLHVAVIREKFRKARIGYLRNEEALVFPDTISIYIQRVKVELSHLHHPS